MLPNLLVVLFYALVLFAPSPNLSSCIFLLLPTCSLHQIIKLRQYALESLFVFQDNMLWKSCATSLVIRDSISKQLPRRNNGHDRLCHEERPLVRAWDERVLSSRYISWGYDRTHHIAALMYRRQTEVPKNTWKKIRGILVCTDVCLVY